MCVWQDYPVPVVTINFQMCDTDPVNGPIRQVSKRKQHSNETPCAARIPPMDPPMDLINGSRWTDWISVDGASVFR